MFQVLLRKEKAETKGRKSLSYGNSIEIMCSFPAFPAVIIFCSWAKSIPFVRVVKERGKYKNIQNLSSKFSAEQVRKVERCRKSMYPPAFPAFMVCLCWRMRAELLDVRDCDRSDPKHLFSRGWPSPVLTPVYTGWVLEYPFYLLIRCLKWQEERFSSWLSALLVVLYIFLVFLTEQKEVHIHDRKRLYKSLSTKYCCCIWTSLRGIDLSKLMGTCWFLYQSILDCFACKRLLKEVTKIWFILLTFPLYNAR